MKALTPDQIMAARDAAKGNELMVFDWDKAAQLIKDTGSQEAAAGLQGDWGWTGGAILGGGKPVPKEDTYTYLASIWATPELRLGDGEKTPCFKMQPETPGWGSDTYWPESALKILNG